MNREAQEGKYGYHPKLADVVKYIKHNKSVSFPDLKDHFNQLHKNTLELVMVQAEALGMVEVHGAGQGRMRRFTYVPNRQFQVDDHRNDQIVKQVRTKLNELKLQDGEGVEISIRKVNIPDEQ